MPILKATKIYLACPYSHKDEAIREKRFEMVTRKAAELMLCGYIVFSPISHSHEIAKRMGASYIIDHDFWMLQDLPYITYWADEFWVFALDGWRESRGIQREMEVALEVNIPVRILKGFTPAGSEKA